MKGFSCGTVRVLNTASQPVSIFVCGRIQNASDGLLRAPELWRCGVLSSFHTELGVFPLYNPGFPFYFQTDLGG